MWKTCGVAIGLLLLLFVAGLVATSQYNSDVFAPNFRGRKLQTETVSSTLSQAAPAGSSQIYLASAIGFAVGQQIEIDSGSTAPAQRHNVTQVIPTASALMIAPATQREHVVGASVRTTHTQSSSFNSFDSISGSDFSQSMRSSESGSSMGDLKATYAWFFGIFGVTWGHIQIVFIVIYACIYKNRVVDVQGQMPEGLSHSTHALEPGLLDCLCDCGMCHIVLYCPFIRAAQNNYAADICGYWETFAIMWLSTFALRVVHRLLERPLPHAYQGAHGAGRRLLH